MENKLTLEHLAPYLPYMVNVIFEYKPSFKCDPNYFKTENLHPSNISIIGKKTYSVVSSKPILRPLSDLTKEIEHNGVKFVPIVELLKIKHKKWYDENVGSSYSDIEFESVPNYAKACFSFQALNSIEVWYKSLELEPYWIIQKLLSWHIDVFNLIPQNLAIDINTL